MKISRNRIYKILNSRNQSVKNINPSKEITTIDKRSRRKRKNANLRYKSLKRGGARLKVETNDKMSRELINEYIEAMNQYVEELMTPIGEPILTGTATEKQINDILERTINKGIKDIVQEASQSNKNILQKLTGNIFSMLIPKATTMSTFETQLQEIVEREKIIISLHLALSPTSLENSTKGKSFTRELKQNVLDPDEKERFDIFNKRFDAFGCGAGMDATFEIMILSQENLVQENFEVVEDKISKLKLRPTKQEFLELQQLLTKLVFKINTLEKIISLYAGSGGLLDIQNDEMHKTPEGPNSVTFYDTQKNIMKQVTLMIEEKANKLSYGSDGISLMNNNNMKLLDTYTEYSINNSEIEKHTLNLPSTVGGAYPESRDGDIEMSTVSSQQKKGTLPDAEPGFRTPKYSPDANVVTPSSDDIISHLRRVNAPPNAEAKLSGVGDESNPSKPAGDIEMQNLPPPAQAKPSPGAAEAKLSAVGNEAKPSSTVPSDGEPPVVKTLAEAVSDVQGKPSRRRRVLESESESDSDSEPPRGNAGEFDASVVDSDEDEDDPERDLVRNDQGVVPAPASNNTISIDDMNDVPANYQPNSNTTLRGKAIPVAVPIGSKQPPFPTPNTPALAQASQDEVDAKERAAAAGQETAARAEAAWNNQPQPPSSYVSTKSTTTQLDNGDVEVNIKVIIPKNANFSVNGNAGTNIEAALTGLTNDINKT